MRATDPHAFNIDATLRLLCHPAHVTTSVHARFHLHRPRCSFIEIRFPFCVGSKPLSFPPPPPSFLSSFILLVELATPRFHNSIENFTQIDARYIYIYIYLRCRFIFEHRPRRRCLLNLPRVTNEQLEYRSSLRLYQFRTISCNMFLIKTDSFERV